MTNGLLIIDQKMNTIIMPMDDSHIIELFRRGIGYPNNLDKVHPHDTLKSLDRDVRAYLKGEYDG